MYLPLYQIAQALFSVKITPWVRPMAEVRLSHCNQWLHKYAETRLIVGSARIELVDSSRPRAVIPQIRLHVSRWPSPDTIDLPRSLWKIPWAWRNISKADFVPSRRHGITIFMDRRIAAMVHEGIRKARRWYRPGMRF